MNIQEETSSNIDYIRDNNSITSIINIYYIIIDKRANGDANGDAYYEGFSESQYMEYIEELEQLRGVGTRVEYIIVNENIITEGINITIKEYD